MYHYQRAVPVSLTHSVSVLYQYHSHTQYSHITHRRSNSKTKPNKLVLEETMTKRIKFRGALASPQARICVATAGACERWIS